MITNFMGDDEQARKDLAEQLRRAKTFVESAESQLIDGLKIPDALVDDVLGRMCGPADKGQRISFINGPWDGQVEYMKTLPEVFQVRMSCNPRLGIDCGGRSNIAVAVFYDVAVYRLQCTPEGLEFYRFDGFSQCMAGLPMRGVQYES